MLPRLTSTLLEAVSATLGFLIDNAVYALLEEAGVTQRPLLDEGEDDVQQPEVLGLSRRDRRRWPTEKPRGYLYYRSSEALLIRVL